MLLKSQLILAVLSLLVGSNFSRRQKPTPNGWNMNNVFDVMPDQLKQLIETNRFVLFHIFPFFSPSHAVLLRLAKVGNETKKHGLPVVVTQACGTMHNFSFTKIPMRSIAIFLDYGKDVVTYIEPGKESDRSWVHLYKWIERMIGNPHKLLITTEEVRAHIKKHRNSSAIIFMDPWKSNTTQFSLYEKAARYTSEINGFGVVYSPRIRKKFNITNNRTEVLLYTRYAPEPFKFPRYEGQPWEEIEDFLMVMEDPPAMHHGIYELYSFESDIYKFRVNMFMLSGDEDSEEIIKEFYDACEPYRYEIKCQYLMVGGEAENNFAAQYGVRLVPGKLRTRVTAKDFQNVSDEEQALKYRPEQGRWETGFLHPENYTMEIVKKEAYVEFFENLLKAKLEPYYLSEVMPKEGDDIELEDLNVTTVKYGTPTKVRKIVGLNFEEFVRADKNKMSIIYFTSGWCMGCNLTVYERFTALALHYTRAGRTDVQFGFSDYALNEYPTLKATSMPRIKMFPKNFGPEFDYEFDSEGYCRLKAWIESEGKKFDCAQPADLEDVDTARQTKDESKYYDQDLLNRKVKTHAHSEL